MNYHSSFLNGISSNSYTNNTSSPTQSLHNGHRDISYRWLQQHPSQIDRCLHFGKTTFLHLTIQIIQLSSYATSTSSTLPFLLNDIGANPQSNFLLSRLTQNLIELEIVFLNKIRSDAITNRPNLDLNAQSLQQSTISFFVSPITFGVIYLPFIQHQTIMGDYIASWKVVISVPNIGPLMQRLCGLKDSAFAITSIIIAPIVAKPKQTHCKKLFSSYLYSCLIRKMFRSVACPIFKGLVNYFDFHLSSAAYICQHCLKNCDIFRSKGNLLQMFSRTPTSNCTLCYLDFVSVILIVLLFFLTLFVTFVSRLHFEQVIFKPIQPFFQYQRTYIKNLKP